MRAVIQAVSSASVRVNGGEPRAIGPGLVILLGVRDTDTLDIVPKLAEKCAGLRIFKDENDKLNLSAKDLGYSALVVSQFTLYGDTKKGFRPSFIHAAKAPLAWMPTSCSSRDGSAGVEGSPARRVRGRHAGGAGERGPLYHRHRHRRVEKEGVKGAYHAGISSDRRCAFYTNSFLLITRQITRSSSTPPPRCRSTIRSCGRRARC